MIRTSHPDIAVSGGTSGEVRVLDSSRSEASAQQNGERAKRSRRKFTREDKIRIVEEADACTERGQLEVLLRREGIYSSHLSAWRKQFSSRTRESRATSEQIEADMASRVAHLERRNALLERELQLALKVIDLHAEAAALLRASLGAASDE